MKTKNIYDGKGQYIGYINQTNSHGNCYDKHGKMIGKWIKLSNMTYDSSNRPYGNGNLLEALVHNYR